jgi:predicted small lipoprotein YifL
VESQSQGRKKTLVKGLAAMLLLTVAGCSQSSPQFLPFGDNDSTVALDTATGQTCVSYQKAATAKGGTNVTGMPYCFDLYSSK